MNKKLVEEHKVLYVTFSSLDLGEPLQNDAQLLQGSDTHQVALFEQGSAGSKPLLTATCTQEVRQNGCRGNECHQFTTGASLYSRAVTPWIVPPLPLKNSPPDRL